MEVVNVKVRDLIPYEKNAKNHPDDQVEHIANSIREFGFRQPLVIDADNVVVIGHGRLMAAKKLGMDEVPCVRADDLSEAQIKALRLADNKTNESEWDFSALDDELGELSTDFDMAQFGFEIDGEDNTCSADEKYNHDVRVPQYEPSDDVPEVVDLIDTEKTAELLAEIENADISEDEKQFLRFASYRHIVIDFDKVADYYAAASHEMQELMERSALVIIDIDDAMANGYAQLSSVLDDIMGLSADEQ